MSEVTKQGQRVKELTRQCVDPKNHTQPCECHEMYDGMVFDPVVTPKGYNSHPSGVECIEITQHFNFCLGNVIKYVWRADHKGGVEDLKKAQQYLKYEIARREKTNG